MLAVKFYDWCDKKGLSYRPLYYKTGNIHKKYLKKIFVRTDDKPAMVYLDRYTIILGSLIKDDDILDMDFIEMNKRLEDFLNENKID